LLGDATAFPVHTALVFYTSISTRLQVSVCYLISRHPINIVIFIILTVKIYLWGHFDAENFDVIVFAVTLKLW